MKATRMILYGALGAILGFMLSIGALYLIDTQLGIAINGVVSSVIIVVGIVLCVYGLSSFGRMISNVEARADLRKSDFSVARRVASVQIIVMVVLNMLVGFSLPVLAANAVLNLLASIAIATVATGAGVWYARRKNVVTANTNTSVVALWIAGIFSVMAVAFLAIAGSLPESGWALTPWVYATIIATILTEFVVVRFFLKRDLMTAGPSGMVRS